MVIRLAAAVALALLAISATGVTGVHSAAPGDGLVTGVVNLPQFPGTVLGNSDRLCGDGDFAGHLASDGQGNPKPPPTCLGGANPSGSLDLDFGYNEPCLTTVAPGLASGELKWAPTGALLQNFLWNRVGLTAIILLSNASYGGSLTATGHVIGEADLLHTGGATTAVLTPLEAPSPFCPGDHGMRFYFVSHLTWSGLL